MANYSFHVVDDTPDNAPVFAVGQPGWSVTMLTEEKTKVLSTHVMEKLITELNDGGGDNTLMWIADQFQLRGEIVVLIKYVKPERKKKRL